MSSMLPSVRGKSWLFQVTALCIVLGALLGLSLRTQRELAKENMPSRIPALRAAFRETQLENKALQEDVTKYKNQIEEISKKKATGENGANSLSKLLDETKLFAGTLDVRGSGVVVTIKDSPKLNNAETRPEIREQFMVHAEDIRAVVDELCSAGAEAISINGERHIATSSIRCVGLVVMMNSVRLAPPYIINAIGDSNVLEKTIMTQGGAADDLILLDMIKVKPESAINVPAYAGSTTFKFASPVTKGSK